MEARRPRLAWKLRDERDGATERAYQVVVASRADLLEAPDLWDSGRVRGPRGATISYAGAPLRSGQSCHWRVRSWDVDGRPTEWSEPASWTMGLLRPSDWKAGWIVPPPGLAGQPEDNACIYFRRQFTVKKGLRRGRLYLSALGLAEPWVNGLRVTDDCLVPGWSDFRRRVQYVAYDATSLLAPGANALGAILAPGWYAGHLGKVNRKFRYGSPPALLAQLVLEYDDGSSETVGTGPDWEAARGAVIASHLYDGEVFDARLDSPDWSRPGFEGWQWAQAEALRGRKPPPASGKRCAAVRRHETLTAAKVSLAPNGEWVFDFGQNLAGWARLRIRAERGREIVVRFAEMLQDDGNLYVANLGSAKATDRYIASGAGEEVWEPRFTFHGFRYAAVSGLDAAPPIEMAAAVVLHTAMPAAGGFTCSDPDLNQLQHNIVWGQRSNFLEVPTDCPQRDERMGWTGDAQVFFRTAAFNRDLAAFFEKWLDDLNDSQCRDGAFTDVAPDIMPEFKPGNAAWADAGVICPWRLYVETGDAAVLERCFGAMRGWIDYQERTSRGCIRPDTRYGDWLATDAVTPYTAPTPRSLIGTAYFAYTTELVGRAARRLGRKAEAARLERLHRRIVRAFQREFVTPAGRVVGDTQTGYCLALAFDLLPPRLRRAGVEHLVRLVADRDFHLSTGFVGTPLLCPVLSRFGRHDVAARLIRQDTYPSWLYPVKLGATTMWERWNSYTRESGFGDASMNSFNHYAYGAIGEWIYATLGGIAPLEAAPGYAVIQCAPRPSAGIAWARAWHETPRGRVSVEWRVARSRFTVEIVVPPDTIAAASLPGRKGAPLRLRSGTHRFTLPYRS